MQLSACAIESIEWLFDSVLAVAVFMFVSQDLSDLLLTLSLSPSLSLSMLSEINVNKRHQVNLTIYCIEWKVEMHCFCCCFRFCLLMGIFSNGIWPLAFLLLFLCLYRFFFFWLFGYLGGCRRLNARTRQQHSLTLLLNHSIFN